MKKMLTVALMLLLMMSFNAFATDTRVMTMGDNNTVLLDDANIWEFPSRLNDYPNLAIGEFSQVNYYESSENFTNFGIHWKFGDDNPWVLGTYFSTLPFYVPMDKFGDFSSLDLELPFELMENRRIDLLYARQLGGNDFGMGFSFLHSSETDDFEFDKSKEAFGFYDFTFGLTEGSGQWDAALNIGFGSWTYEDEDGEAIAEPDGFMDIGLMGRYFWQQNPNVTLIPHVAVEYSKRGLKSGDFSEEVKATNMDLGCGMNYTPATNVLAVLDFGFRYAKVKESDSDDLDNSYTSWHFPYFKIGLDADVFKWMDIRLGATSFWNSETSEFTSGSKENMRYAENDTYLGFGFHWGRLHIDTYTDPELFLDGFNFLSGTSNNMNFQISALYEMM